MENIERSVGISVQRQRTYRAEMPTLLQRFFRNVPTAGTGLAGVRRINFDYLRVHFQPSSKEQSETATKRHLIWICLSRLVTAPLGRYSPVSSSCLGLGEEDIFLTLSFSTAIKPY